MLSFLVAERIEVKPNPSPPIQNICAIIYPEDNRMTPEDHPPKITAQPVKVQTDKK